MKEIRRGGHIADDHVTIPAGLQESLQPRTGVLRALAFISMRQQKHKTTHPVPLTFRSADVLIDDSLCAVEEISKLSFPQDQMIRTRKAIPVFKSQHGKFR